MRTRYSGSWARRRIAASVAKFTRRSRKHSRPQRNRRRGRAGLARHWRCPAVGLALFEPNRVVAPTTNFCKSGCGLGLFLNSRLIGVAVRAALAQRAGMLLGPIGAIFLLLGLVVASRGMSTPIGGVVFALIVIGCVTPILWTRRGAKSYFGLICPRCGDTNVSPESFTYAERRCGKCATIFAGDGRVLRVATWPPGPPPTATGATSVPIAPTIHPPTTPGPLGGLPTHGWGPPGKMRNVDWFLGLSIWCS